MRKPDPPAPLQQIEMPKAPWEQVHVDYCGPVPTGEYLLVVTDRYSHFPEVAIVNSTKASSLFIQLDRIFAVHGIPELIISDNGSPFNSDEFSRYVKAIGSIHHPITPRWPQASREVQSTVRKDNSSRSCRRKSLETRTTTVPSSISYNATFYNKGCTVRTIVQQTSSRKIAYSQTEKSCKQAQDRSRKRRKDSEIPE